MSFSLNRDKAILDDALNVRILDSSGNSIVSNSGALRVSTIGSTFNIKASDLTNILTTNGCIRTADYTNDLINGFYISGSFTSSYTLQKMKF